MKKPVLVIMAAGMGSRYGGLKQIDPVDDQGHIIMDFSIFDAKRAGFEKVVFIIKKENEADFKEAIGDRIEKKQPGRYAQLYNDKYPEDKRKKHLIVLAKFFPKIPNSLAAILVTTPVVLIMKSLVVH